MKKKGNRKKNIYIYIYLSWSSYISFEIIMNNKECKIKVFRKKKIDN